METILTAVIASILTAVFTLAIQYYLLEFSRLRELHTERLTKLLLPLYMKINEEVMDAGAEMTNQNGDPAGFFADLSRYYEDLFPILRKNLYLADEELTEKAIRFISWAKVDKYDKTRFEKIMINGTNDANLSEFKKCVIKKYKREQKYLFNKQPFWSLLALR